MQIVTPPDFSIKIKNRILLLDTSVFIDASINPSKFEEFFEVLRQNGCQLVSADLVTAEFVKGKVSLVEINKKEKIVKDIIESYFPITEETTQNFLKLLKLYKEDGNSISITDLTLGSILMQNSDIFLITKNTNDFPTNIFGLETFFNLFHRKAIQSYGVYSFAQD
jgi:predicted nucleic acid-binding protein